MKAALWLTLWAACASFPLLPQAVVGEKGTLPEAGKTLAAELAPGQVQSYEIRLDAGVFLHVDVLRQGADLAAKIIDPAGRELIQVARMAMDYPKLHFALVTATSGTYRLEVGWNNPGAKAARYEIQTEELRPATGIDRKRYEAESAAREGDRLRGGPLESRRNAIARYDYARQLFHELEDRENEASTLVSLGAGHYLLGEPELAIPYFQQALPLKQVLEDFKGEANLWSNMGVVYSSLGEMAKALDAYSHALPLARKAQDPRLEARSLANMGASLSDLGRPEKALEAYQEAQTASRAAKDAATESQVLANTGRVYAGFGQRERAVANLEQALAIARAGGDVRAQALVDNQLGAVHADENDFAKALGYHEQALSLARSIGDKRTEAQGLQQTARMRLRLGNAQNAVEESTGALSLFRSVGDRQNEGATLRDLGEEQLVLRHSAEAEDLHLQALAIQRAIGARLDEADTLSALARCERASAKLEQAREHIDAALTIYEDMRRRVATPNFRATYFAGLHEKYELSLDLLMTLDEREPARGLGREALALSERARARVLLDRLTEARAEIEQDADPAMAERLHALRALLQAKGERQVRVLAASHTRAQARAVEEEITALTRELEDVEAQVRAKRPRYDALMQPALPATGELQRNLLDRDTALVEFALGAERSFAWAITSDSFHSFRLPKRAELERIARRAYEGLNSPYPKDRIDAVEQLSRMLLDPVWQTLKDKKRLLVVSDGALHYVPFGVLRPAHGEPLVARMEIVNLPSIQTLLALRRESQGRTPAARPVAVFADPVFSRDDPRLIAKAEQPPQPGIEHLTRSLTDMGLVLDRLPATRREAAAIAGLTPPGHVITKLDFEASRKNALGESLSQYRILHFATHGLLNSRHPELSGLVLSLVDREGNPQNGFLAAHEIYGLKLNADLVVLSACQTALGAEIRGEGLISLTRAFMYAGAPRVVASLWRVPDAATAELMKHFYRGVLTERLRPAAALRRAQEALRNEKRWSAPYYWAGFTLQGDFN